MRPGLSPACSGDLRAESQRCLLGFLTLEIELGFTLVETAAYQQELGHVEHSQHSRAEAGNAVASIRHFLNRVSSPEVRGAIADRCRELDQAVAAL